MTWISREYKIESHNDLCAKGKALANILEELLGKEFIAPTGFISQRILPLGEKTERKDCIGVSIRNGYVINDEMWDGNKFNHVIGTRRKICQVKIKEIEGGHFGKPFKFEISINWTSKEEFIERVQLSAFKIEKDSLVKWSDMKEGSKIYYKDKTKHKVTITAIGNENFLAVDENGNENMYQENKEWRWSEYG